MRRILIAATCLVGVLFAGGASGGVPISRTPLSWTQQYGSNLQSPVEQESPNFFFCGGSQGPIYCAFDPSTWVNNPTPCVWDVDDFLYYSAIGSLDGGKSSSHTECMISDGFNNYGNDDHPVFVRVVAPVSSLRVTLTNSLGATFLVPARASGKQWVYDTCTTDRTPGPYPVIEGSNGGTGMRVDYTVTVTNPTAKTVKPIGGIFDVGAGVIDTSTC